MLAGRLLFVKCWGALMGKYYARKWYVRWLGFYAGIYVCALLANEILQEPSSWHEYVASYTRSFFIKRLGWDPNITLYYDQRVDLIMSDCCTVYCHGWGESQEALRRKQACGLLPGTLIGFDFYDSVKDDRDISFARSSFGQDEDCKALCAVLKLVDEAGCPVIHLYGYSRGGAAVANSMKRLKQYYIHQKFFKSLGMSKKQVSSIMQRIARGTIILDCPLIDMREIIKYRCPHSAGFVDYIVMPLLTGCRYAAWKDQAIDAAPILRDFNVLFHAQYNDRVVTNICDVHFYTAVKSPTTHVIFADDGGHFHKGQTLCGGLQAFRKKYHGPYYDDAILQCAGEQLLAISQPAEVDIELYFNQYVLDDKNEQCIREKQINSFSP